MPWLREKFERYCVTNAAGSLACRKQKCLSNKPITSSKRQDPIFITPTRREIVIEDWIWQTNEDSFFMLNSILSIRLNASIYHTKKQNEHLMRNSTIFFLSKNYNQK
jgi:hypothetical protein